MSVFENISTPNLNEQGNTGDRLSRPQRESSGYLVLLSA